MWGKWSTLPRRLPNCFLFGAIFLYALDKVIPHLHLFAKKEEAEGMETNWRKTILLVLAIALHNIPEGLAVGVAFGALASPELTGMNEVFSIGAAIATIISPAIENHFAASFSINLLKASPNLNDRYETTKKRNPLDTKQTIKNIKILKPIIPLVIVNTLKGRGVKPARNRVPKK